jgi:hypothetical protein
MIMMLVGRLAVAVVRSTPSQSARGGGTRARAARRARTCARAAPASPSPYVMRMRTIASVPNFALQTALNFQPELPRP